MAQNNEPLLEIGVDRLMDQLGGPNRRRRQEVSQRIAELAREDRGKLEAHLDIVMPALVDALYRQEAQTRWQVLEALYELAADHPDEVLEAYDGAEAALFDEESSTVRVAAFKLLARLGSTSPERSDKVWPLLDEAIQCYHGDYGYRDMLGSLLEFVKGDVSDASKKALVDRISFDAKSGRGYVKGCSAEIIEAAGAK